MPVFVIKQPGQGNGTINAYILEGKRSNGGCWHSGCLGTLGVSQVEDNNPLLAVRFADNPSGTDLKILNRKI